MRALVVLMLGLLAAAAAACAPKIVAAPPVTAPRFPEFIKPAVPPALAGTSAAILHDRAWRFLQAGDLKSAERELGLALRAEPTFYPAEAASGYVDLARKDPNSALPHFDRALEQQGNYVSALVGRGDTLVALDREADAVVSFEAAIAADPALADLRRRVEVLRFRGLQRDIASARDAAQANRTEEATRAYEAAIAASPESPFLYRELAAVERRSGDTGRALEHLRRAVELDSSDAGSLAQIGDLLSARGETDAALAAYHESLALEPNPAVEARRDALVAKVELAKLPPEYRALERSPQVTRADLAALIGVRFGPLLQATLPREAVVITDVRRHWAESWIVAVAGAGVMEPYENHTFQPATVVRRIDLAQAVSQLLARAAPAARLKTWRSSQATFADISTGHLAYSAASLAVTSGVMSADPDGRFQPSRIVTGQEAIDAIQRLQSISGVTGPKSTLR